MSDLFKSIQDAGPLVGSLAAAGVLVLSNMALKSAIAIYKLYLRPGKNLKKLGEWAVVTGATDGIGKAFAIGFAKKGLNVVLISRTESKLQEVSNEIAKEFPNSTTKYVVCDYSKFDQNAQDTVRKAIQDLDVGVLVNNVGVSYRYPVFFHELKDEEVANLMEMNVNSTTWMTRLVLKGMVERKRGAIVNISSGSAMGSFPLLSQYSAAKSYIVRFSQGLNAEYKGKGITCQSHIPFYIATKLAKLRKSMMVPTPKEYVKVALNWIGYPDAVVSPFPLHALQSWVIDQLPLFLLEPQVLKMHLSIRAKGQKKDAKLAAEAAKKGE